MWKAGWFLQERSVKECEGVWWNMVVVTPDQFYFFLFDSYTGSSFTAMQIF